MSNNVPQTIIEPWTTGPWVRWFAIWPVRLYDTQRCVWLRVVWRRWMTGGYGNVDYFDYTDTPDRYPMRTGPQPTIS